MLLLSFSYWMQCLFEDGLCVTGGSLLQQNIGILIE